MADAVSTQEDMLSKLVGHFDEAELNTDESREEAENSRDYYDGKQLTAEEVSTLEKRGQPPVIDNKIKDKIDTLVGIEIASKTDPKAFPRNPGNDEKAAEAVTDALRFIAQNNDFDDVKTEVGDNFFVEGSGVAGITYNPDTDEIGVNHIMWDRWFYDPHSRKRDYKDAKYLGEAIWMDLDDAKRKYPGHEEEFDLSITEAHSQYGETYADKPLSKWVDPKRKRVRILEIYFRERTWMRAVIGRHSMIEAPKESVYLDENGKPEHPYSARSCYVDRNGNRYGVVRRYKDLQDEHNKRRSKLLHLASARTVAAEKGAVESVPRAKKELAKPDGWIEVNPGKSFDIVDNNAEIAAHTNLLIQTDNALSQTGPNAALSGLSDAPSGRARQLDQAAGSVALSRLFDGGLDKWEVVAYRKMWNRVRQFWTDEKWIRVRDNERNLKFVSLNHKKTEGDAFNELMEIALATDGPLPPEPQDPSKPLLTSTGQPIIENDVAELDVDIIIEQAPDLVNIQAEQFGELSQMAQSGVPIPPDAIIEASSLRNKRQILATMRGDTPEQRQAAQQQQQLQDLFTRLEILERQAKIDKLASETEENLAEAENERADAELKVVEAVRAGLGEEKIG